MKKIINKKIILIGTLILIAIIALVNIYNDLGKNTSFEIENYKITLKDLKAKKLGINSKYTAEFSNYNFIDMTKETFYVDFIDISDEIIINSLDNEDTLKKIKIGNKKFQYYFDNTKTCGQDAIMYYKIPNSNDYLTIKIRGGEIKSLSGGLAKCLANTTKTTLRDSELNKLMKFKIEHN